MDKAMYDKGLSVRRRVLGTEYVDARMAELDEFSLELNQYVTTYAWGEIWDRPGLPKKVRSMLCLAMLSAINRPHEIKTHIRGAFNNGLTKTRSKKSFSKSRYIAARQPLSTAYGLPGSISPRKKKAKNRSIY